MKRNVVIVDLTREHNLRDLEIRKFLLVGLFGLELEKRDVFVSLVARGKEYFNTQKI